MASYQVRVDGHWLTELATWGDLQTIHGWPGDCLEASWAMTTRYKGHHPAFHRDAEVIVNHGGLDIWGGLLQEPEWNGREAQITARGWYRAGEDYPAFGADALATDNPAVAIAAQADRGLQWRPDATVPNASLIDGAPERGNSLAALMDAYGEKTSTQWGVDARRRVYFADSIPTFNLVTGTYLVDYHVRIGAAELSVAEDSFASHVALWYLSDTSDVYKAAFHPPYADSGPVDGSAYERRHGHRDWLRDITDLGPMPDAAAESLATSIYDRGLLRPSFTEGIDLFPGELLSNGGVNVGFNSVKVNKRVRVHGPRDPVTHKSYTDFVVGKITRAQSVKSIRLDPVSVASKSDEDIYQELLEQAWANAGGAP